MKNIDKYNKIKKEIGVKSEEYLKNFYNLPKIYYKVARLSFRQMTVSKITLFINCGYSNEEKITNIHIEHLNNILNNINDCFVEENVRFNYEYKEMWGDNNVSKVLGADSLSKILNDDNYFFDIDKALLKRNSLNKIYKSKEGHLPCDYCQRQILKEKMIKHTLISFHTFKNTNGRKDGLFCSGKCAGSAQMSLEG